MDEAVDLAAWVHVRDLATRSIARQGKLEPVASARAAIDLTQKEVEGYSLLRAISAASRNDWSKAGFEKEISNACFSVMKTSPRNERAFMFPSAIPYAVKGAPRELSERAVYQVGTASQGGNIVGTELKAGDFIEVLRNRTVIGQLGARFLPGLVQNVNIPRQNAQSQTYWVGESVSVTESEATFDQVQLRPHVVGALSKVSRLMLQQATPAIEQIVRDDLNATQALAIDLAALAGTGSSSQPTGILNTPNVGSVVGGTNGANLSFDMMIQLYTAPLVANAPQANLGFAFNAKAKGYLSTLKSSTGQYLWNPLSGVAGSLPDQIVGYRYAVSNQLPYNLTKGTSTGNCSALIFGNWQELLIGEWGAIEILVNPYDSTGFSNGDILIRSFSTVDVGLRHPASMAVTTDALTPGF
jgi:HK97 family phage major capsid protein